MNLTVGNFFTHLIFHPKDARKEDYHKCLYTSVAAGVVTLGMLPLVVGVGWMIKHTYVWMTGQLSGKEEKINKFSSSKIASIDEPDAPIIKLPVGPVNWEKSFLHVGILNARCYEINGKIVKLRKPVIPQKIERDQTGSFTQQIFSLKMQLGGFIEKAPKICIKDMTTDQAICNGNQHKIALNFANEKHAGGGPGIYKDLESKQIKWGGTGSAQAQEEALVNKSDLFSSLTMLPTKPEKRDGDTMVRNYYEYGGFDSRTTVYTSDNQLFGVWVGDFYTTQFLEIPRDVSFVTSAAGFYRFEKKVAVDDGSEAYIDATDRIRMHLYAAAVKAVEMRKRDAGKPVELILGAFGCGAFAPKDNAQEYATMIATIYRKELPQFNGFFDEITFAIPKMGKTNPENPCVRNFNAFDTVIMACQNSF